jgi:hypothetical protein
VVRFAPMPSSRRSRHRRYRTRPRRGREGRLRVGSVRVSSCLPSAARCPPVGPDDLPRPLSGRFQPCNRSDATTVTSSPRRECADSTMSAATSECRTNTLGSAVGDVRPCAMHDALATRSGSVIEAVEDAPTRIGNPRNDGLEHVPEPRFRHAHDHFACSDHAGSTATCSWWRSRNLVAMVGGVMPNGLIRRDHHL